MTMAEITRKMAARFKGGREGAPPAPVSAMVLFLDIDGVICTTLSTCLSALLRLPLERQIFDPLALFWLRRLVRRTGAEIVLCSSWRDALEADDPLCRAFIANLYEALARNGTPIADAAPQRKQGGGDPGLAGGAPRRSLCDPGRPRPLRPGGPGALGAGAGEPGAPAEAGPGGAEAVF